MKIIKIAESIFFHPLKQKKIKLMMKKSENTPIKFTIQMSGM